MSKFIDLTGQKFTRLLVLEEEIGEFRKNRTTFKCQCDCGEICYITSKELKNGDTKSCGCLRKENSSIIVYQAHKAKTKYSPDEASYRDKYYQYQENAKLRNIEFNLSFEEFKNLSINNCKYCGIKAQLFNKFLIEKRSSKYAQNNGNIFINGIDRKDNQLGYLYDNCCACCFICNRAKLNRSEYDFIQYINKLNINNAILNYTLLELPNKYVLGTLKKIYRDYKNDYGDMEIDLQTFYTYSQQPCFYCGTEKLNYQNIYKYIRYSQMAQEQGNFYYNGIDRIDSDKDHSIDNIVPACKFCNTAKLNLSMAEFYDWIIRIKTFQQNKNGSDKKSDPFKLI